MNTGEMLIWTELGTQMHIIIIGLCLAIIAQIFYEILKEFFTDTLKWTVLNRMIAFSVIALLLAMLMANSVFHLTNLLKTKQTIETKINANPLNKDLSNNK